MLDGRQPRCDVHCWMFRCNNWQDPVVRTQSWKQSVHCVSYLITQESNIHLCFSKWKCQSCEIQLQCAAEMRKYELYIYIFCAAEVRNYEFYIYIYIYTCMHTYEYAHVQTERHMAHAETFTHSCIHMGMDAPMHTHSHTYTHTTIHPLTHTCKGKGKFQLWTGCDI